MTPHISIIVLNWNGKSLTSDCLHSLKKVTYPRFSVSVVDNGSTDGSVEFLESEFPDINLIKLHRNYRYAGGNNRGFEVVFPQPEKSGYALFLNNDTLVEPEFLDKLVAGIAEFGGDHIFSPKILYADHPDRIWFAGGVANLTVANVSHIGIREIDNGRFKQNTHTDFVSGCALMIHADVFHKLGGFDESFGMYSEDVDLCLRAANQGVSCYMIAKSKIYHKVSASIGGNRSFLKNTRKLWALLKLIRRHKGYFITLISFVCLVYQISKQYFNSTKFRQ